MRRRMEISWKDMSRRMEMNWKNMRRRMEMNWRYMKRRMGINWKDMRRRMEMNWKYMRRRMGIKKRYGRIMEANLTYFRRSFLPDTVHPGCLHFPQWTIHKEGEKIKSTDASQKIRVRVWYQDPFSKTATAASPGVALTCESLQIVTGYSSNMLAY